MMANTATKKNENLTELREHEEKEVVRVITNVELDVADLVIKMFYLKLELLSEDINMQNIILKRKDSMEKELFKEITELGSQY